MDAIADPVEKQATIGIIHNFGQTPRQLFKRPHAPRMLFPPVVSYKVHRQPQLLFQAPKPVLQIGQPVRAISLLGERPAAFGAQRILVPGRTGQTAARYVEWGYVDGSARIYQTDLERPIAVFEALHTAQITCVQFADDKTLVVGGADMVSLEIDRCFRPSLIQYLIQFTRRSPSGISTKTSWSSSIFCRSSVVTDLQLRAWPCRDRTTLSLVALLKTPMPSFGISAG